MNDTWERIHDAALTRHEDGGAELARLVIEADGPFQALAAKRDARMKAEGLREAVEFLEEQPLGISSQMNSVSDVLQLVSSALLARAEEVEKGGA